MPLLVAALLAGARRRVAALLAGARRRVAALLAGAHRRAAPRRLTALAALAASTAVVAGLLAAPARADEGPQPTTQTQQAPASPSPSPVVPPVSTPPVSTPPAASATPTVIPTTPPAATTGSPSESATPDTTASAAPDGNDPAAQPQPGTDGELPAFGVDDAYWNAFRLLQSRQRDLARAERVLKDADQVLAAARTTAAQLQTTADSAAADAASTRLLLDRLAGRLYQYGTPVSAVGAMLGSPEDFLGVLDRTQNDDVAAELVVGQASAADVRAAAVRALLVAAATRVDAASAARDTASAAVRTARQRLAQATKDLADLAGAKPQTVVGTDGCPKTDVPGTLRGGAEAIGARKLCRAAITGAATPQAALALRWAFAHLGAAYACGGAGRMLPWRMDCSSLVSRAYHEGAGLPVAGAGWAPSTRDMVPWDGVALDPHYALVDPVHLRPGDLVLYDTGGATYRHVVLYLGPARKGGTPWMLHTNSCGDVAKVEPFWGFSSTGSHTFLVARRVLHLPSDPAVHAPAAR